MISSPRLYRTKAAARGPLLSFMLRSLERAGCRILWTSSPDRAPLILAFETPEGERMGVVAYAFLATRTLTKNRPPNERSFQLKYSSKEDFADKNLHSLWQDPLGIFTTLLLGIDPEGGFFVAADPEAHNPTKFFIRVEFKDEHAEAIMDKGWHPWERSRRNSLMAEPVEVLVGGRSEAFLDLVRFERAAHGFAPGERQLLAEKRGTLWGDKVVLEEKVDANAALLHPLLAELQLSADEVFTLIAGAGRLKMAVRGWVAEEHLRTKLAAYDGVTDCARLNVEGGSDIQLRYRGGPPLTIECKNVLRVPNKTLNLPRIDFQRTRASKGDACSRYYAPSDFDIVAGCLHAVTERWEFRFADPLSLDPHLKCEGKLASNVTVDDRWKADPRIAFEAAAARLSSNG